MTAGDHNLRGSAPGYRALRWNMDWITRPLFGIGLAVVAIVSLFLGPLAFALFVAIGATPASFEWQRLVAQGRPPAHGVGHVPGAIGAASVALTVLAVGALYPLWVAMLAMGVGAVALIVWALREGRSVGWPLLGLFYLAIPCAALVALPAFRAADGGRIVLGLFVIVWATDTGALIVGNLVGGPRLAPKLSPGKTWSGTLGGSLIAGLAFGGFAVLLNGVGFGPAFLFAFLFSFVAHAGDLFESYVKRHFGVKNSGAIIPGHGGVLDRIDSTMAAAPALALLVFLFHFDPLLGLHP
jgi:phosphatidate cytidylyltransferase